MRDLRSDLKARLEDAAFFRKNDRLLIACSGGPDSVALVHLFALIAPGNRWKLGILHYDHRLRSASKADAMFVRRLARGLGLAFYGGAGDVKRAALRTKTSLEEAARKMRYDFFLRTAKRLKVKKVVLAHTLDDQAETVLMRILQGTGLRGLRGIREVNRMEGVLFIRPLLAYAKSDLLDFLRTAKIGFRRDESNQSRRFLRNRIRLKLLPALRRDFNPRIVESLARIPVIAAREIALLDELEAGAWKKTFKKHERHKVELRRGDFLGLPVPIQFRVIERALKKIDPRSGLSYEAWERIQKGLSRPRNRWSLPKHIDLTLTPKTMVLYKRNIPGKQDHGEGNEV
ncbi:MAG: tRNA(Ile)-lysidine synthase [Candidatus Omnitrophica bacterium ADurb.Bin314]|nr:MAG: tRNA(Ile)-lysidine synthase [Candidatus Omnitrophica bacterium ADurb.Bin314]